MERVLHCLGVEPGQFAVGFTKVLQPNLQPSLFEQACYPTYSGRSYYRLTTTYPYYLLPTTYYLLPTTYYLLPTTYYVPGLLQGGRVARSTQT